MRISKKAAIELSMNMIVVIVLSIVILGAGVMLTRMVFKGSTDIQQTLDEKTQAAIEDSLRDSPVSIPFSEKKAGRGEARLYGLGVKNILDGEKQFRFNVTFLRAQPAMNSTEVKLNLLFNPSPFSLEENDIKISPIKISVTGDALSGTYVYTVKVDYLEGADWVQYQSKNIYITVS